MSTIQSGDDGDLFWYRLAHAIWPDNEWVSGNGRFASVCPHAPWDSSEECTTIELYELEQDAHAAASAKHCYPTRDRAACTGEPVCKTLADLMSEPNPAEESLPHDVVDLAQVLEADPGLADRAKAVILPEPTDFRALSRRLKILWELDDKAQLLPTVDACLLLQQEFKPPEFLVEHLVPKVGIALDTGDTGSQKTAFAAHALTAIALDRKVANLFETSGDPARPILYFNGEMGSADIHRVFAQAAAGFGERIPPGRLHIVGDDGVSPFGFGLARDARSDAFEALLELMRPCLVVFDSLRALAEINENDAREVRQFFNWLRYLSNRFECAFLVLHHVRKLSMVSNSSRERVSGSRDLLACVDIHFANVSYNGRPTVALELGKTRSPYNDVTAGTRWALKAELLPGPDSNSPSRSTFSATREAAKLTVDALALERERILSPLREGPRTRKELGADAGNAKRAFDALLEQRIIVVSGKHGRKQRYALSDKPSPNGALGEP